MNEQGFAPVYFLIGTLVLFGLALGVIVPRAMRRCCEKQAVIEEPCPRFGHGVGY